MGDSLSLVILAAGLGSRFGGDKPLSAVGPAGQALFEYSVYDAFQAGFRHIVFVVNESQDTTEFSARLLSYGDKLKVEFIVQSVFESEVSTKHKTIDRIKPWGTGHAVLTCRDYINNPFVVINADDYYGKSSYETVGRFLLQHDASKSVAALSGYHLINTLSASGGVNRGVCCIGPDGYLESISEVTNIVADSSLMPRGDNSVVSPEIHAESIVSMTFWGFMPSIFKLLEAEWRVFLEQAQDLTQDEFYLPSCVNHAVLSDQLQVKVFTAPESWIGLTYAADVAGVKEFIKKLVEDGIYDASLS